MELDALQRCGFLRGEFSCVFSSPRGFVGSDILILAGIPYWNGTGDISNSFGHML